MQAVIVFWPAVAHLATAKAYRSHILQPNFQSSSPEVRSLGIRLPAESDWPRCRRL